MGEIDVCSHGRPDHQELVRELREVVGLPGPPLPISPKEAFEEALDAIGRLRAERDRLRVQLAHIEGREVQE